MEDKTMKGAPKEESAPSQKPEPEIVLTNTYSQHESAPEPDSQEAQEAEDLEQQLEGNNLDEDTLLKLEVTPESASNTRMRLDRYLACTVEGLSRSRLQKLIQDGKVQVNNIQAKASLTLEIGDHIQICLPPPEILEATAEDIPLEIVYEDNDLLVINKPAGMVTHPGAGVKTGTLVNAVLYHAKGSLSSIGGVVRPGIVHRLDKDTSGLIMVAKNDLAHLDLSRQLKEKSARRTYQAVLEGHLAQEFGTVNAAIGRHPNKRKEMAVIKTGAQARDAVTHYSTLGSYHRFTHVECRLDTGRTHQIRVHMAYLGAPVAGDIIYNHKTSGTLEARRKLGLSGQALHAVKLSFTHPRTGELLEFTSALPEDIQTFISSLK